MPERHLSPRAGSMNPRQSAITPWGWSFYTTWGGIDPGDLRFRPQFVGIVRDIEVFMFRGWNIMFLGCGGTSTLAQGAALVTRWLHEPQTINNQPVGLGFPRRARRYRPRRSPFSSSSCRSCRCMEGFMMRGWNLILPGACLLYLRTPANQRSAGGAGFPHRAGRC